MPERHQDKAMIPDAIPSLASGFDKGVDLSLSQKIFLVCNHILYKTSHGDEKRTPVVIDRKLPFARALFTYRDRLSRVYCRYLFLFFHFFNLHSTYGHQL